MAESDAATMERLRKEMGKKVEIPVPEGMIPVHDNKATAVLAAPGDLDRLREMAQELVLSTLADPLAVVRLPGNAVVPDWATRGIFCSITRTPHELSIVTSIAAVPADAQRTSGPWTAFMVHGPLDFTLKGILSKIAAALAGADVSIFAISTYDTDYVLVPSADAEKARSALTASGTCRFADA